MTASALTPFSERYFTNYDGEGRSYREFMKVGVTDPFVFKAHATALKMLAPASILDIGAADGSALLHFKTALQSLEVLHGIEISEYAHQRRLLDSFALGDLRQVLRSPPAWMLKKYDLILFASAMYLGETGLKQALNDIRPLCHASTLVLVLTPGEYFPGGLFDYSDMASKSLGHHDGVLIRPKMWWLSRCLESGYSVVGDVGGTCLLLRTSLSGTSILNWGCREVVSARFGNTGLMEESDSLQSVVLTVLDYSFACTFNITRDRGLVQETNLATDVDDYRSVEIIRHTVAYVRCGMLGSITRLNYSPIKTYAYIPGVLCFPSTDGYIFESDTNL